MKILTDVCYYAIIITVLLTVGVNSHAALPPRVVHYTADQNQSLLEFTFRQAGAKNKGKFLVFFASLDLVSGDPSSSRLEVKINTRSLDTQDEDRDNLLRGSDLFYTDKYPQAQFSATHIIETETGFNAVGELSIRGTVRKTHLPFTLVETERNGNTVNHMVGKTTINRLDFGVGQGDWKSDAWVADEVTISYSLRLDIAKETPYLVNAIAQTCAIDTK